MIVASGFYPIKIEFDPPHITLLSLLSLRSLQRCLSAHLCIAQPQPDAFRRFTVTRATMQPAEQTGGTLPPTSNAKERFPAKTNRARHSVKRPDAENKNPPVTHFSAVIMSGTDFLLCFFI